MKTFEERYTAWIDGQLEGSALTAFEQELTRRAAAGEAQADRKDTQSLRHLLRSHLEAPVLTNPEFFSHQLRQRLNGERTGTAGRAAASAPASRGGLFSFFPWSVARLAGTGAACLFVAGALYYGLEPGPASMGNQAKVVVQPVTPAVQPQSPGDLPAAVPAPAQARDPQASPLFAKASPTPVPLFDDSPDIQVHGASPASPASATALIYPKPNVNVLWTNGLDYLPDVPGVAGTPASAATPAPAPSASAAP